MVRFDTHTDGCYNCEIEKEYSKTLEEKVLLLEQHIMTLMGMLNTDREAIPKLSGSLLTGDLSLASVEQPLNSVLDASMDKLSGESEHMEMPAFNGAVFSSTGQPHDAVLTSSIKDFAGDKGTMTPTSTIHSSVNGSLTSGGLPLVESGNDSVSTISVETISQESFSDVSNDISEPRIACVPVVCSGTKPFEFFSATELIRGTEFTHTLRNREVAYYGPYSYSYGGITHEAGNSSERNDHFLRICSYLGVIMPSFNYNSALIQRYKDGSCTIPQHSDDEPEIVPGSNIVTISLGATRDMVFTNLENQVVDTIKLEHGSVVIFSQKSQSQFRHGIPASNTTEERVSITFRLIRPLPDTIPTVPVPLSQKKDQIPPVLAPSKQGRSRTLYLSDSMFRHLNSKKLSSDTQLAKVLFYPGATAHMIKKKLEKELCHLDNLDMVDRVVLLAGTNNVDPVYYGQQKLNEVKMQLNDLIAFIKSKFSNAKIILTNILPRINKGRNDVISELNMYLEKCAKEHTDYMFVDTESKFKLFSVGGRRTERYFMPGNARYDDNCHLNGAGIVRLSKHLKFVAHH